jgi:hypothetical protein
LAASRMARSVTLKVLVYPEPLHFFFFSWSCRFYPELGCLPWTLCYFTLNSETLQRMPHCTVFFLFFFFVFLVLEF